MLPAEAETSNSGALLVASIGGQSTAREFSYGTTADENFTIDLTFDARPLTGGRVVIVVAVQAERQSLDDRVTIAFDTADAFRVERSSS